MHARLAVGLSTHRRRGFMTPSRMIRIGVALVLPLALLSAGCHNDPPSSPDEPIRQKTTEHVPDRDAPPASAEDIAFQQCESRTGFPPPPPPHHHYGLGGVSEAVSEGDLVPGSAAWADRVLLESEAFVGRYGNLDENPPQRQALLNVLSRPAPVAVSAFKAVLEHGQLAGKLYALVGLQRVDPTEFEQQLEPFLGSKDWVLYYNYDTIDCERVGELINRIASGTVGQWIIEGETRTP